MLNFGDFHSDAECFKVPLPMNDIGIFSVSSMAAKAAKRNGEKLRKRLLLRLKERISLKLQSEFTPQLHPFHSLSIPSFPRSLSFFSSIPCFRSQSSSMIIAANLILKKETKEDTNKEKRRTMNWRN
jgi:hypothetical protein